MFDQRNKQNNKLELCFSRRVINTKHFEIQPSTNPFETGFSLVTDSIFFSKKPIIQFYLQFVVKKNDDSGKNINIISVVDLIPGC